MNNVAAVKADMRHVEAPEGKLPSSITDGDNAPLSFLYSSDSDDGAVNNITIKDGGSDPKCVTVLLHGVPVTGLVDSGADKTIMGGELFKHVAVAVKLQKWELKRAAKTPRTYDQRTFTLHGSLDLDIESDGHVLNTPIHTGDALPKCIPARRISLAVHQEISKQLCVIQVAEVIQPSHSS